MHDAAYIFLVSRFIPCINFFAGKLQFKDFYWPAVSCSYQGLRYIHIHICTYCGDDLYQFVQTIEKIDDLLDYNLYSSH